MELPGLCLLLPMTASLACEEVHYKPGGRCSMKGPKGCVSLEEGAIGWASWRRRRVLSRVELTIQVTVGMKWKKAPSRVLGT